MEKDRSILLQKQIKDNSEDLQNEFLDMKNWEEQMRRKDEELKKEASGQTTLPPVRSKNKKKVQKTVAKESENTAKSKRIRSYDYSSWDKFDVDKACKEIDKEDLSDDSGDEVMSKEELEKAYEIATKHKQEGNIFVQQQQWGKAIACYSEAIKICPYDAIFYANRALCQLKLDNLYSAEADCSAAIQLDEDYIKAYHRRATARMGLKQYKEAKQDLEKILKLEPSNKEAKSLLAEVEKKIETCSSTNTSTRAKDIKKDKKTENKNTDNKNIDNKNTGTKQGERDPRIPEWLPEKDDVAVVDPIEKPPHLRSKKPLTRIPVEEVEFSLMQSNDRDDRIVCNKDQPRESPKTVKIDVPNETHGFTKVSESPENATEIPQIPKTAVQFLMDWRRNKSPEYRYKYLKQLPKNSLSKIFQDSMESDIFSQILETLRTEFIKTEEPLFQYLEDLSQVKRFRALIMFISKADKEGLKTLFEHCIKFENVPEEEVMVLADKYEV